MHVINKGKIIKMGCFGQPHVVAHHSVVWYVSPQTNMS